MSQTTSSGSFQALRKSSTNEQYQYGVRESMTVLPEWLQPMLTLVTGKPLAHQVSTKVMSTSSDLALTVLFLVSIWVGMLFIFSMHPIIGVILTLPSGIVATGLIRKLQVVFAHHAIHGTLFQKNAKANQLALHMITTFALLQAGKEYKIEHFGHHNRSIFTTYEDADAALLFSLGFKPKTNRKALWSKLYLSLASPIVHLRLLMARLRSNLFKQPLPWKIASWLWLGFITVGLATMTDWWHVALVVWLPMFIFYNISAILQFITEHAWMVSDDSPADKNLYAERCWGRFVGEPCPETNLSGLVKYISWTKWWTRLLVIHLPVRMGCLVGDLPAHDWHHLCGFVGHQAADWPRAIFVREEAIASGSDMGMGDRELWGLRGMLEHVFMKLEMAEAN